MCSQDSGGTAQVAVLRQLRRDLPLRQRVPPRADVPRQGVPSEPAVPQRDGADQMHQ